MKARLFVLAIAIGMFASVAGTAAASPDAGAFQGQATVGKNFINVNDGTKTSVCTDQTAHKLRAQGTGLFIPQPLEPTRVKTGTWHFKTGVISAANAGQLDACGTLGPNEAGVGASCGMSQGIGAGKIRIGLAHPASKTAKSNHNGQIIQLKNIKWETSAGGFLPVTADVSWANAQKVKKPKTGKLVAQVIASGGQACLNPKTKEKKSDQGAQTFNVVGVYEIIQP